MRPLPVIKPPRSLPPLAIQHDRLENGLAVSTVERRGLPVVHVELLMAGGIERDDAAHAGRASMTAELLDEGTARFGALEIAERLDHLGAHFSVHAGWDVTMASLHVLSSRLDSALDIVADVMQNATFPSDEFERKKKERLSALQQEHDEAAIVAGKALAAGVFGAAHPYGLPPDGTLETVAALTREDLVGVYEAQVAPANMRIIAVGDIDPETFVADTAARFGGWTGNAAAPTSTVPAANGGDRRILLVDKPGAAQAEVRVGHSAPSRTTPDYFAMTVMNAMLGGSFTSRLNTILRERMGVTYGASSRFRLRRNGGIFVAGAAILTEAAARSAEVIVEEMERIRSEEVTGEELRRAQSFIALGLPRSFEAAEDIAGHVREQLLYGLPADYWQQYVANVIAVTPAQVREAAARHLHPDTATIAIVADRKDVQQALEQTKLGEVVLTDVAT